MILNLIFPPSGSDSEVNLSGGSLGIANLSIRYGTIQEVSTKVKPVMQTGRTIMGNSLTLSISQGPSQFCPSTPWSPAPNTLNLPWDRGR